MKIQISIDDKLLERIDTYASNNYMSRSGLISFSCNQYLNGVEAMMMLKDMSLAMRKIADTGTLDSETMEVLENFERVSKMITGQ